MRSRPEFGCLTDRGNAAVLDHDGAALDRRALDGQDPVG
jgi:hypothetical protein